MLLTAPKLWPSDSPSGQLSRAGLGIQEEFLEALKCWDHKLKWSTVQAGRSAGDITETLVGMHWNQAEGFTGSRLNTWRYRAGSWRGLHRETMKQVECTGVGNHFLSGTLRESLK